MVEILEGSWWRCKHTHKNVQAIGVRGGYATALFPDGSSENMDTDEFLSDFTPLPHCTGFDWVPVSRWFVSSCWKDGCILVEKAANGSTCGYEKTGERKFTSIQHEWIDQYVSEGSWREIPEAEAAAILEKARNPPKPRYYQNPSGFKNGTLFRLRDTDGLVWSVLAGGEKRLHGRWQEHHDRYVAQGLWVEVTEDFVNRTLDAQFPEKADFPAPETEAKQETGKPTFWHVKLGSGNVCTYFGSSTDGKCVMVIRAVDHGCTPGTYSDLGPDAKFPKLQADDILIEGSPLMFAALAQAIGANAVQTSLRTRTKETKCTGCECGT